ncbi:hypothetical protein C0Q70_15261 [Pomacea canaliculata]|uniref:Histone H2A C-terminal domain-containing protein n=1 Tax=Pomacea canaliculata TaxID=400727 RepID=A0A2T7NUE4_POMCA|nr:hypothetical protein C0Q70_15261 [Pomacea canaliculata]
MVLPMGGIHPRLLRKDNILPSAWVLQMATRNDEKLNKLLSGVTIAQGGVLPNIQPSSSLRKLGSLQAVAAAACYSSSQL